MPEFKTVLPVEAPHVDGRYAMFSVETRDWLKSFQRRFSISEVIQCIENCRSTRVLVVGEAILDEYVFCNGLGMSTKDPIIALLYRSTETHIGGSLAIANHLAGLCDEVGLITFLGDSDRREKFIREHLRPNVKPWFLTKPNSPTIHKRRFADKYTKNKLFELYVMNDTMIDGESEREFLSMLTEVMCQYDAVVVADYGHGVMSRSAIEIICTEAPFLTVNTQSNAGNRGFNTITKYPRADYVCLATYEVSIETRVRDGDPRALLSEVAERIDCSLFTMTRGQLGTLHFNKGDDFVEVPALAGRVVDRVGGGDAVLAVTALLAQKNVPWEIAGFWGNLAGAHIVGEIGNKVSLTRDLMVEAGKSLME